MHIFKRKHNTSTSSTTTHGSPAGITMSIEPLYKHKVQLKCSRCKKVISEYWEYLHGYGNMSSSSWSTQSNSCNYYYSEDEVEKVCESCRLLEKLKE